MPLYTFGGTPADVLTDDSGNVVPDYPLLVKVAGTGATVTALFEDDGTTPIDLLRSDDTDSPTPGRIRPFKAMDVPEIDFEYLDGGGQPVRWYQAGREIASGAMAASQQALAEVDSKLDTETDDAQNVAGPVTFESPISAPNLNDQSAVRWFVVQNAAGDGVTDDLAKIQAQLDAARDAGGGIVYIPPGRTYAVSSFIVVYANTTVWAYGARLKSVHATTGVLRNFLGTDVYNGYQGQSHIKILGGIWDCNAYSSALGTGVVTATTNTMCFIHCEDITVRDCRLVDSSSAHALEFNAVKGAVVESCRFEGFIDNSGDGSRLSSEAIQIDIAKSGSSSIGAFDGTPCVDIRISGCYFGPSARLGAFGRAVGSHAEVATKYFDDITIENCLVEGALETGIHGWNWRRARIIGNTIRTTADCGIFVSVPDPAGGTIYSSYGITIANNVVEGAATNSGIRVLGYDTAQITDVVITGNTIRGAAGSTANGIQSQCTPGAKIADNLIDGVLSTGIFPQYSDGVSVLGNTVRSSSSNGVNVAGCTAATVVGNTIDGTSTNHGIVIGGGSDGRNGPDALVAANRVNAAAVAGIRVSQAGCHINGNKVTKGAGATANGVSLTSTATGCTITNNDLSGNSWTSAAAIVTSTAAPVTTAGGSTALPGSNSVGQLGTPTLATVANTTSQTAVASATIPANDAVAGTAYQFTVHGNASTTGTPTLAVDIALGGTQLAAVRAAAATASALSSAGWEIDVLLYCVASGVSATWTGRAVLHSRFTNGAAGAIVQDLGLINTTVAKDSTAAQALTVRATWGTASASNTITATAATFARAA